MVTKRNIIEKLPEEKVKSFLEKMKLDSNWTGIGWLFWEAFLTLPNGSRRRTFSKLYSSFTKKQRKMMEEV